MKTTTAAKSEGTSDSPAWSQARFRTHLTALVDNIRQAVVVSEETVRCVVLGLLSQGHVLLEDTPSVGKTLLAKSLALSIQGRFSRIQCTPDLLPSDITGTSVFDMRDSRFEFKPGPVFSNILLADEINRTGPRTQSALLEAMAEFQVSADGETYPVPRPFMVIATQNNAEHYGVFPLPDSQLDRFLIRMSIGLPAESQEVEILSRAEHSAPSLSPVISAEDVISMQAAVREVNVALPVKQYLVHLARASREHPFVARGMSPRGTVLLQRAAQGWAAFEGRSYLTPEDIKRVAPLVLPHRIVSPTASDLSATEIVAEVLESTPVPL